MGRAPHASVRPCPAQVAEWVSNNLGKAAEAFGKVFPLCVSSNLTEPGMVIAAAIQARAVTRRALLPIRVRRCVALRWVAMGCAWLRQSLLANPPANGSGFDYMKCKDHVFKEASPRPGADAGLVPMLAAGGAGG